MLGTLSGKGWTMVEPPAPQDGDSVVGRFNGQPVKAGFRTEIVQDSDNIFHTKYRSGKYDLEVKIDLEIGRGQVRVVEAEGYDG